MPNIYFTPEQLPYKVSSSADLTGQRFGRLNVLRPVGQYARPSGKRIGQQVTLLWECKCDCGRIYTTKASGLQRGTTNSCGCLRRELSVIHGQWNTRGYRARHNMIHRCYMPSHPGFNRYGGRGIRVCQGWRESPKSFVNDVGQPPSIGHSLDRVNNNGNYSCGHCPECLEKGWPMNVRWATQDEQHDNRENTQWITIDGETKSITAWSVVSGVKKDTIYGRIRSGRWPNVKEAVFMPPHTRPRTRHMKKFVSQ